jgi:AraC-like DNA-binding protein/mannose-6-phosphate isomerase-like protein (cupin superfamily)
MDIIQYENYQEKEVGADPSFPYQTYICSIPLDFIEVPLHWHDEVEFIYIKKGKGRIAVDFQYYDVSERDIILVLPGQLHSIGQSQGEVMEYENIIFQYNLLLSRQPDICGKEYLLPLFQQQLNVPTLFSPNDTGYTSIAGCLDDIDSIRHTFPPGYQLFTKGKLFELFFGLLSTCSNSEPVHNSRRLNMDKTRQILKYMEQHYAEKISIETIANVTGFSESHFMKFFKSALGTSFTAYLNDYRLTMASRLLLASDDPIIGIAEDTGFDNLSYFNRSFKKKFGMTPSEFRKTH